MTEARVPNDVDQFRQRYVLFVRTAAHALRTPLQSLQGFAELLEPGVSPAQVDYYLGFVRRDAALLAGVVDDLCLRDEMERGPLSLFPSAIEVGPLLTKLAQTFEARFSDCLVALEYTDEVPAVYADADRLLHILGTLLRNAERCRTDRGRLGWLTVRARLAVQGGQVVFEVDDDADRIPPETASTTFESMPDPEADPGQLRPGVRLGLYVARELARQMGGDLWLATVQAASGQQHGNTFVLSVPIHDG